MGIADLQLIIAVAVFGAVLLTIAFDLVDMTLAALLGCVVLAVAGIISTGDAARAMSSGSSTITLFFGGMVVARCLRQTSLFDLLAALFLRFVRGSGRRFLLGIILFIAPVCAVLPNATVVIMMAPVVIAAARSLEVEIAPPLILMVIVSNSAGLLTLVGDPATFIVGNAIGLSFSRYIETVSLGGLAGLLVLVPMARLAFSDVWKLRVEMAPKPLPAIERPVLLGASLVVLALMVALFGFGGQLDPSISPPLVAILAATLALLVAEFARVEPIGDVFRDIDWKTIVFFACMFFLVEGLVHAGALKAESRILADALGTQLVTASLVLVASVAGISGLMPNIPVVIAMVPTVKGYLVASGLAPEAALAAGYSDWPAGILPVFVAMMFGATLGGNATVIGAASNIVAAGIAAQNGQPISFGRFLRYGLPVTLAQIAVAAVYLWLLGTMLGTADLPLVPAPPEN
jgi:Na+/H+ antiporter NhaD/arsenite permease-like protein